jgi:hypothetical protein
MLGSNMKRAVEASLDRIYQATNNKFVSLDVYWGGKTAGIVMNGGSAKIMFPNVDDTKQVPDNKFHDLLGYAIHELGHAWFTNDKPWDEARRQHGSFVGSLINGLEDPRIERKVIESGYAPNGRVLFERLCNSILLEDGYVEPDDLKNVPFLLAIEGRRLNGYSLICSSIVERSPWRSDIEWALNAAHVAKDTAEIVRIAIELNKRLQEAQQPNQPDKPEQTGQPGQPGQPGQGGQPGDQQGDQPGQPGEGNKPGDKPGKTKGNKPGKGKGKGEGRPVEPDDFINRGLADHVYPNEDGRLIVGKVIYQKFPWEHK